ncbi:MAG TPA: MgtC/SapB family protein [Gemmatimonadales bacterium]|nr:MgtC/SapB family protein [Gemmatimonadales bacterium]
MLNFDIHVAANLAIAGLAGLAVGIEREWSGHTSGPDARFAGARTFLLLGVLGGLSGWWIGGGYLLPGTVVLAGSLAFVTVAYAIAARKPGGTADGTTEVAALVVLAIGATAGLGFRLLTSAIASLMVLALIEKTRIHDAVRRIGERELAATLQFAVLALVILPLLPSGPYGPFDAIRPRVIWAVVLLFSGLNFVGYLARKAIGARRGYGVAGILGGLISSTVVTLQFSRKSRHDLPAGIPLALGVIGACTVLVPRVLVVTTILNPATGWALVPYLLPVLLLGTVIVGVAFLRTPVTPDATPLAEDRNPLGLGSSIQMALAFQAVLLAVPFVQSLWGNPGVLASAGILGLTNMDALTFSMAKLGTTPSAVTLGAEAIAIGVLANTVLKFALAVGLGRGPYRRAATTGLAALGVASIVGLWLGLAIG